MGDSPGIRRSPSPIRAGIPLFGNELPLNLDLSRRDLLKLGGYAGVAAFLAACAQGGTGGGGGATFAKGGRVTVGSNQSDPTPKKAMEDVNAAFSKWNGGTTLKMNTVDHGTFQDQINS
nr:hypothetical protein [Candidatus Dormibacteraeota bacterium]